MKPTVAASGAVPEGNKKSGTTIVKSAPPKETARITVKPSLPNATVKPAGATPVVKAAAAAPAPGATPAAATTPVNVPGKPAVAKTAVVQGAPVAKAPAAGAAVKAAPVAAVPVAAFAEESSGSTTLTTSLAGALAALSCITAGYLWACVYGMAPF